MLDNLPIELINNITRFLDDIYIIRLSTVFPYIKFTLNDYYSENTIKKSNKFIFKKVSKCRNLNNLPKYINSLELSIFFNRLILFLPYNIKVLEIPNSYNHPLNLGNTRIHTLKFYKTEENLWNFQEYFNNTIISLPKTLETLVLQDGFNQPLPIIPKLKYLSIKGFGFNQSIQNLPETLKYLNLGESFNKEISNLPNLRILKLNGLFNKPLNNLSEKLEMLTLSEKFNQPLDNLPSNLKKLSLRPLIDYNEVWEYIQSPFNKPINNLPINLVELTLGSKFNQSLDKLPPSLKILSLGINFNQTINNLPRSLEKLLIYGKFNQPINNLPQNLKYLYLGTDFNHPIDYLPDSLIHLEITGVFNQPISKLPSNLKYLIFGTYIYGLDYINNNYMYGRLKGISKFNKKINLPENLEYLIFSEKSDFNTYIEKFPKNMKELKLPRLYNAEICNYDNVKLVSVGITHLKIDIT